MRMYLSEFGPSYDYSKVIRLVFRLRILDGILFSYIFI